MTTIKGLVEYINECGFDPMLLREVSDEVIRGIDEIRNSLRELLRESESIGKQIESWQGSESPRRETAERLLSLERKELLEKLDRIVDGEVKS